MEQNKSKSLALMKAQLRDMTLNPEKYEVALSSGFVVAGFGGNLNGIHVPETLLSGKIPPDSSPKQALEEVVAFMKKAIAQAEAEQRTKISD